MVQKAKEQHPEAKYIVEKLAEAGFHAYYAGGWVRDYLLNHPSDDIDIATNAPPETIQKLFPRNVPIGIAFGIILVLIDDKEFEVATFRSDIAYIDGRRPTRVEFTTAKEDAKRRDFTINGMFYDPLKEEILDYVEGKKDLEKKIIRAIGNAHERIKEDRLRMIRAVRLASRLNFSIEPQTIQAIRAHANELFPAVAIERIWQEFYKMSNYPGFCKSLITLHEFGLLQTIFPDLKGTNTAEIQKRLHAIDDFPKGTPVIAYLLELFPEYDLDQRTKLCKYLKLSNTEIQFVHFLYEAENMEKKHKIENIEWAYFYANAFSNKCIMIFAARLPIHDRNSYLEKHEERKHQLQKAIFRIQHRDPVVKSQHLKEQGIPPGAKMGKLLMEAERIAINDDLEDPQKVLAKLKKLPLWTT